jgi:ribosomal subunit interface protein
MDIVLNSRHCELSDSFRDHVEEKLARLEKHDHRVIRVEVEVEKERNPRQSDRAVRVELTAFSKGPVVRAEAAAEDKMAALDVAIDRMAAQMRRAADRRRVHHGRRTPASVRMSDNTVDAGAPELAISSALDRERQLSEGPNVTDLDEHLPGQVVREKHHPATPMTVDQALHEMELVGHDFFLFQCAETGQPTVVYRRHAYDYGLIRLTEVPQNGTGPAHAAKAAAHEAAAPA